LNNSQDRAYLTDLEGIKAPLGVILYLIRRDNIDIYDIPIAKITRDYLEYLDDMERHQIELAGEFFVLAATLMRIKVQMLLRRDDDEEDPREELVRNLLEYKKMVEAARSFKELEEERMRVFHRPVPAEEKEFKGEPVLELNLFEIMRAFREIMIEFEAAEVREIQREEFSLEEKMELIEERLRAEGQVRFHDLFRDATSRLEVIVTFIAVLELMKRSLIKGRQEQLFSDIWVYPNEPEETEGAEADEPDEAGSSALPTSDGVDEPAGAARMDEFQTRRTTVKSDEAPNATRDDAGEPLAPSDPPTKD